ncbi:MAG: hypothetical protein F6J98_06590 [Moorea sp. SIO4G2]|uniref:hypothetical protein n=1 Tax=Moorena sp. SIO3I6 TaxID=2607831 RepID=UPI0013FABD32|nr:hypothetical protein [Moorena sp. SIO3I6]NEO60107.1 hypothetical protein [Moorena sp. SIO4G2]NEP26688.1 hypothetical protein [Moorena sp. SIO3I6]
MNCDERKQRTSELYHNTKKSSYILTMFPIPYSLFSIPCFLFSVPYSLFPVPFLYQSYVYLSNKNTIYSK